MRHYLAEPFQNDLDFIYFISFALKNTKKNPWRYANTSNKNETIH